LIAKVNSSTEITTHSRRLPKRAFHGAHTK
jgi:hypothetical protein